MDKWLVERTKRLHDEDRVLNTFEITEQETALIQRALNAYQAKHPTEQTGELRALFTPHQQHGLTDMCGAHYCRCCE